MNTPSINFDCFTKKELRAFADRLLKCDAIAIEWCVTFVEQETRGVGHGRARAMMSRRLKHCPLSQHQRSRLVRVVLDRLVRGTFSEQFKDQLRLAMHLDPAATRKVADDCSNAAVAHIRRYATWLLSHKSAAAN